MNFTKSFLYVMSSFISSAIATLAAIGTVAVFENRAHFATPATAIIFLAIFIGGLI